ncbi:BAG family molecular chaperone regulator 4 [Morella rubra]|uniref:BAG family molecular chaperone regulator 4 n=1 Tax=Morella rubra TaxID=262757 RepID=A0A6A1WKQ6_9ROSI|nr:BAG family molecular chaperone regulator 4 [Morella rubra]
MKSSSSKRLVDDGFNREIDWELRPGGMLVQKRDVGDASSGPMIKIKVSHDSYHHDITVPAQSTFGDLKKVLSYETGLEPKEQRLLFRGKEKEDGESLHMAGVKDMSKVLLLEDPASKERKLEEMEKNQCILKAFEAVLNVRAEVDRLSEKVIALEATVCSGTKVVEKELVILTELLMEQLLKLDTIKADGEAKVRRVQSSVETLDNLKARNFNPFSNSRDVVPVTTEWETFEPGVGSLDRPAALLRSSTKITEDWEVFD